MVELFEQKSEQLFNKVTSDKRWDISNQTLFNVFALSYYGYSFGLGHLICFLDPEKINSFVQHKLVGLGAGEKYVTGLIDFAYSTFLQPTEGINAQLVGIGHSHFSAEDTTQLTNAIFNNAKSIDEGKTNQ